MFYLDGIVYSEGRVGRMYSRTIKSAHSHQKVWTIIIITNKILNSLIIF